jgi:hypothetical protein
VRRLALLSVFVSAPTGALAYEDQLAVGLDVGYADVATTRVGAGFGGGPHAKIGLDDTWNLYAAGFYSYHPGETLHVATLGAGVEYVFDVLQWIPWGGLGAEVLWAAQGDEQGAEGGIQAALGLDYLASRSYSVGIVLRGHTILSALDTFPLYGTLALRGSLDFDL